MSLFSLEYLEGLADQYAVPFVINLVLAAIVFVVGRAVSRLIVRAIDKLMQRAQMDDSLRKFLSDVAYALLLVIVAIAALERLGVKTTAAIAVLGAAGLAVGLALQGSLGNFASGVMIITFKPYRVGDAVVVAGQTGKVEAVKVFNTVLVTGDNRQIMVPNGTITSGTIENLTTRGTRRIDLVFGIGYGDDMKRAKEIIEGVVKADQRVLPEPAPQIAVSELADSSVNLVCRPWVKADDYWAARFDIVERVKEALDAAGITIPYPQRDVHLHQQRSA